MLKLSRSQLLLNGILVVAIAYLLLSRRNADNYDNELFGVTTPPPSTDAAVQHEFAHKVNPSYRASPADVGQKLIAKASRLRPSNDVSQEHAPEVKQPELAHHTGDGGLSLGFQTFGTRGSLTDKKCAPVAQFDKDDDLLRFSFDGHEHYSATRIGDHSYKLQNQRLELKGCLPNMTAAQSAYSSCACHFQPTAVGCLISFELSHRNCSPDVRFCAEAGVYHLSRSGHSKNRWTGQCCMVKEATCTWDLKPSQNHVVAFVASERWKEQLHDLNGHVLKPPTAVDFTPYITLREASCGRRKRSTTECGILREPGQSYGSRNSGRPAMGGNLEVFPQTTSEEQCARLCCLLGAACKIYTWFAPGHVYAAKDIAYRCIFAAEGEKWFEDKPREKLRGAFSGRKKTLFPPTLKARGYERLWNNSELDQGTKMPLAVDACSVDEEFSALVQSHQKQLLMGDSTQQTAKSCASHYDCSVRGIRPVEHSDASPLWKSASFFPAVGKCRNTRPGALNLRLGTCACEPEGVVELDSHGQCKLRPGRCRTDEHCSPPIHGAVRGYCFTEAGRMANLNPADPDFGICYCLKDSILTKAADGTTYCRASSLDEDSDSDSDNMCRDSAGTVVVGPKLDVEAGSASTGVQREVGSLTSNAKVCVFIGTAFEDSVTKTIMRGGAPVELQFNFSRRRYAIQETWANNNTFMVWSKYLDKPPDVGPNARWKFKSIAVDIAVDLPYGRVAHRFFKVPEFLAQDFVDQGETADCDWMIMTDDDAYVNIPQWENLFRNTAWMRPQDKWYLGPLMGFGFHKGSVGCIHGTSIVFSRGAISSFGTWAADCYKYFDSAHGHVEHWGDAAVGKCLLLHGWCQALGSSFIASLRFMCKPFAVKFELVRQTNSKVFVGNGPAPNSALTTSTQTARSNTWTRGKLRKSAFSVPTNLPWKACTSFTKNLRNFIHLVVIHHGASYARVKCGILDCATLLTGSFLTQITSEQYSHEVLIIGAGYLVWSLSLALMIFA
eukprot:INCI3672.9.p1 GENE.INCI3672.9~~INCI3672.9.p1  ORF type:complete len:1007 (-),score=108.49 INCI3672.9:2517-5537(-)